MSGLNGPPWLDQDLQRIEQLLVEVAGASSHPLVSAPSLHLLQAGGKRLRPALVLLSSRAGTPGDRSTDLAAAAIELIHVASLYHDDVIDGTDTRRGVPTAHSRWGTEVAVLAGDYLFALGCSLGAEAGGAVPRILARALAEVCEGQITETAALGEARRPVEDYVHTIRLKTAALFKASCELGSTTSGVRDGELEALSSFGEKLGLAFQIVDDLLDILGDPGVIGKMPGTDLRAGVFTVPILLASARDGGLAERIESGERRLEALMPVLRSTGALRDSMGMAASFAAEAKRALDGVRTGEYRGALEALADGVLAQVEPLPA